MAHRNRFFASAPAMALTACLAVGVFVPGSANAGFFMGDFTGWTMMSDTPASGAIVNFAVYNNVGGGNWQSDLSITNPQIGGAIDSSGGSTIDVNASYVYFYEVVTTPTTTNALSLFSVPSYSTPYSSGGYLKTTVFNDSAGAIGPTGNQYIGSEPSSTPPDNQQYYYPSQSGQSLTSPDFVSSANAKAPGGGIDLGGAGGAVPGEAVFQFNLGNTLSNGKYSDILFLTSNVAPTYSNGAVSSGALFSDGNIPTQAPEPTTLAMWGLGTLGLAFAAWRRKQNAVVSA